MKRILLFLFVLGGFSVWAQKPKHYEALAKSSEQINDYTGAAYYYKKAYELDSSRLDIYLNCAQALYKDNNYKKAEFAFEYYYYHPLREGSIDALFYLALNQQYNGRYKQAAKNFRDFQKLEGNEHPLFDEAKQREKSCGYAMVNEKDPKYFEVFHLDRSINTIHSEFAPYLEEDSNITFAALKYAEYDYANRLPEKSADQAIKIWKGVINQPNSTTLIDSSTQAEYSHIANFSKAFNNLALATICETSNNCGIYWLSYNKDSIFNVKKLNNSINAPQALNTHPRICIIEKDTFLLFSSNRNGGFGGFDIYFSSFKNGDFTEPQNIGQRVNSQGNEITPFFHNDSSYLYFSSDWHEGYGGYDVFRVKGDFESHSFPENTGSLINSSTNDLYFNYSEGKQYGTFVSNRKGSISLRGETCCNDIYFFKHKIEKERKDTVVAELPDEPDNATAAVVSNEIPAEISTAFTVYFPNDQPKPRGIATSSALAYQEIFEMYENQKQAYKGVDSTDYFFDILFSGSYKKLQKMKQTLKNYTSQDTIYLNLKGFASPLASSTYNKNLAARRIDAIIQFLEIPETLNLVLNIQPIGERSGLASFLSNLNNNKSVYSLPAMKERKVEISLTNKRVTD